MSGPNRTSSSIDDSTVAGVTLEVLGVNAQNHATVEVTPTGVVIRRCADPFVNARGLPTWSDNHSFYGIPLVRFGR
jgi:hypothetical protein